MPRQPNSDRWGLCYLQHQATSVGAHGQLGHQLGPPAAVGGPGPMHHPQGSVLLLLCSSGGLARLHGWCRRRRSVWWPALEGERRGEKESGTVFFQRPFHRGVALPTHQVRTPELCASPWPAACPPTHRQTGAGSHPAPRIASPRLIPPTPTPGLLAGRALPSSLRPSRSTASRPQPSVSVTPHRVPATS